MEPVLKDIHLPAPIGWWPLAPVWYVLLLLLVAFLFWSAWYYRKKTAMRKKIFSEYQRIVLNHQVEKNNIKTLQALNILLKRICFFRAETRRLVNLTGKDWLSCLDELIGSEEFSKGAGQLLEDSYKKDSEADLQPLFDLVKKTLNKALSQKKLWQRRVNSEAYDV